MELSEALPTDVLKDKGEEKAKKGKEKKEKPKKEKAPKQKSETAASSGGNCSTLICTCVDEDRFASRFCMFLLFLLFLLCVLVINGPWLFWD